MWDHISNLHAESGVVRQVLGMSGLVTYALLSVIRQMVALGL